MPSLIISVIIIICEACHLWSVDEMVRDNAAVKITSKFWRKNIYC